MRITRCALRNEQPALRAMPNPATEKLLKILRLEAQTGYRDKAVTRGLQSFAAAWLADAARNDIDPAWAETIAQEMRNYSASADEAHRRAALDALMTRLRSPVLRSSTQAHAKGTPSPREGAMMFATENQAAADSEMPPVEIAPVVTTAPPRRTEPPRPPEHLAQPSRREPRAPRPREAGLGLDAPVTKVVGIGDFNAQKLARLGVHTIRDLLYYFPTRYDDYSAMKTINQLFYGEQVTLIGRIASVRKHRTRSNLIIVRAVIEDKSGAIECSWFTSERYVDHLMKQLSVGREIVISGKVTEYLGRLTFQNPTYEPAEREWITGGSIVPVYRLTEGLQPLLLRRVMKRMVEYWPSRVPEHLPEEVRSELGLVSIAEALREIHFPRSMKSQEHARRRLAFDELFTIQLAVLRQRQIWRQAPAPPLRVDPAVRDRLIAALPYQLTGAQQRALQAIIKDLGQPNAMHRLLQGDVGSGKTVVAALSMALAASLGAQSAMMAPTEILAEQHYKTIQRLFDGFAEREATAPITLALLTGSTKPTEKRAIYDGLANGSIHVVIGTHALIQETVSFQNLGLVVIDEQHRFGVLQRAALRQKGGALNPHTLVMTATPIPRTLALTLYGDLDNTVLDEMPPGRQPIETHWFPPAERERAYRFVQHQVEQGRQAFIICPLVEESDKIEAKAAVEEYERLQREVFPTLKLGLLHGKMKPAEKEQAMRAFAGGETHILVSTSVVEVGIDVPNATVILIEGANRFGLAQLHQFRGRVGRGEHKSYCLLIADTSSAISDQRLQAIVNTQDGFKLAEIDLEIRGPGEFFGTRQSGAPEFKLVSVSDRDLLDAARAQAEKLLDHDPELTQHPLLAEKVSEFWKHREAVGDAS
ncbi:MAG: ATP-dependent DNA helicase RecG [Chloroflexi bacterium]|uniref:ATP-dependent DNA helicase RecG n=1 Tax=Candidatus Thermofonsia Clade 3 bacterium TaxID=2364212 RepID=A0A2M8QF68_9CHLR|nr:ATP-dependent DNA helicase RecG [Candidatus Roseilinea sp. NK_OTU-006]PJF48456.1 MAG: DNA helicase RecG [Candidatus Thermofonsia Clade 3 bacterium]RMG66164.1 MAG: ATP-dependent DNA helicase RecG [Chloroflexota bacterium]